jgi:thiamine pyrophosphokinase
VAADGGANRLYELRQQGLDVIIGDLDSLKPAARDFYTGLEQPAEVIHIADQESTDFAKAISYIRASRAEAIDIVAVGSLGGRVDQGVSQLHHLYLFQEGPGYTAGRVFLVTSQSITFLLKPGKHQIQVRDGGDDVFAKYVGILPIGEPSVITTSGLEWDVEDWPTQFGGRMSTSNHIRPEVNEVEVSTTKDVLFTIALQGPEE